jgi:hypothetical protein
MMTSMANAGFDLAYLFRTFMDDQKQDVKADGIIVIDETGLADKVSLEGPCFAGPEGAEIARKWFKNEIGVAFTEQTRNMTTYVIRKRQAPRPPPRGELIPDRAGKCLSQESFCSKMMFQ